MKFALEEVFNKIRWDPQLKSQRADIKISYIHRGYENDENTIFFSSIKKIERGYFVIETLFDENTYIPFHRVKLVWNSKTEEVFYEKSKKS